MTTLLQRADLTHRHNSKLGRHGWLRLTPAYSVKLVEDLLIRNPSATHVLDPFCGTATTPLCATYKGLKATAFDINPFLIWFGRAKTAYYGSYVLQETLQTAERIMLLMSRDAVEPAPAPPIHNIGRWWSDKELLFLRSLKSAIDMSAEPRSPTHDLLSVAFCRTMIRLSDAAFNHQSMSFANGKSSATCQGLLFEDAVDHWCEYKCDIEFIINSARDNPDLQPEISQVDARRIPSEYRNREFDLLVTSPPYPNRMSYIRELRPYMYWLGFLSSAREAADVDWKAIGGTWGVATSRLMDWSPQESAYYPPYLPALLERIADAENASGKLLSNYVRKYFHDMWLHLESTWNCMPSGGKVHYIIGNSSFYGVIIPAEEIYRDMMFELGFADVAVTALRKRNSKKELLEFDVSASVP